MKRITRYFQISEVFKITVGESKYGLAMCTYLANVTSAYSRRQSAFLSRLDQAADWANTALSCRL